MKESLLLYNLKLNCFFYRFKQLTDYIYTDTYCKLSKCIGQTLYSSEHYLVVDNVSTWAERFAIIQADHMFWGCIVSA